MIKTIKIIIHAEVELPNKAEVIRFKDEEGDMEDYIKFTGKLFRPCINWLEYCPSHITKEIYHGALKSISWGPMDDDVYNKYFSASPENWYLEEK